MSDEHPCSLPFVGLEQESNESGEGKQASFWEFSSVKQSAISDPLIIPSRKIRRCQRRRELLLSDIINSFLRTSAVNSAARLPADFFKKNDRVGKGLFRR